MKNVYILTEEGREYSKEGMTVVADNIRECFGETDEFLFSMGKAYNEPKILYDELMRHKDSYVVMSTDTGIPSICDENIMILCEELQKELQKQTGKTSWEIAVSLLPEDDC